MRVGLIGPCGRMGRAIARLLGEEKAGTVTAAIDSATDLAAIGAGAIDVLIDFSNPGATAAACGLAERLMLPLLVGTTGLGPEQHAAIDAAARTIPVLQTGNTSLGINLLRVLVRDAAARLGDGWDIEIVEMHHRGKLDTPSGTALMLGAAANSGRGHGATERNRFDRMQEGPHPREPGGIYYASLRGGTVAGEHQVIFAGEGERIELGHRAENRLVFARGAIKAAAWLIGQLAGRYTMADMFVAPGG